VSRQTETDVRRFSDRSQAGRMLAERLRDYRGRDDVIVLGLPRGGVPVAWQVARELDAPIDVYLVRKLGVPGHEELALGAIATGGVRVLNKELIERLGLPTEWLEAIDAKERRELERRERAYRGSRPPPDLAGRVVILVDDGLATGSTMLAAVQAVRQDDPAKIVVAVPVAAPEVCSALRSAADEVICALTPQPMHAVGLWYDDFSQTSDEEVRDLLARARQPPAPAGLDESALHRLTGAREDLDPLLARARGARHVLLGEASHGTHEFYRERGEITKRLIAEGGCTAVAVEADWPDAYRVNRFVRGGEEDRTPEEALRGFRRFPVWMWRNTVVLEFVGWLRDYNDALAQDAPRVGFYGLDLYSLQASMDAVVEFLDRADPQAAARARERYACFDQFGRDPQVYAYETGIAGAEPCEEQAVQQLVELLGRPSGDGATGERAADPDARFYAEQNARLVVNAERYYRSMFRGGVESWNLRDRHMAETLEQLSAHLERTSGRAKVAVWEHNSHLGDNRATELGQAGQLNVGQLVRERHGSDALLVGFTTFTGTVTAASDWGGPAERKNVLPALPGSWEELFHEKGTAAFLLDPSRLHGRRLERAIGVIYQPQTERVSHYFNARLADQFDAVIHLDETSAVEPLERTSEWEQGELPETFPTGV
jgi:erythromycin esterase-like protein/predicted phosphoribosyltransferase